MRHGMPDRQTIEVFDRDIRENGGYGYTTNVSLSGSPGDAALA